MAQLSAMVRQVADAITARKHHSRRLICAVAGAPGAGKSTLAEGIVDTLNARSEPAAALVPMDGYHFDNRILEERGLLPRKGAPETFDSRGFVNCVARLAQCDHDVVIPVFDRERDIAIAGARVVSSSTGILIIEGNYLLLDAAPWCDLTAYFDMSVFLDVPINELERRLIQRWLDHGLDADAARSRALSNDIPNARLVVQNSRVADMTI